MLVKIRYRTEIELIRSYIDIQRMSFLKDFNISLLINGEFLNIQIPPFLFFHMVEEGFVVLDNFTKNTDFTILIKAEPNNLLFSMTLWNDKSLNNRFNPEVMENCHKYLSYFYPENHKVISNFEINFVEVILEIYF